MQVRELAALLGVPFEGNGDALISAAAPLDSAGSADLAFAGSLKACAQAGASDAGCLIVPPEFKNDPPRPVLRAADPRALFAAAVALIYPAPTVETGLHPSAVVHPSASIDTTCSIGPHASIGQSSSIGERTSIGPGCRVGDGVSIGADCRLEANVTVYRGVQIGSRVILHSGCVLGADGFGFVLHVDHYEKFPQIGSVQIGDDVEIGANSCVDRAALGTTRIGDGCKLDNMVHIGHNCLIGKHVVIAAQTGLSGGVTVGDYAVIGGQVGIGDKARIEAHTVLGSGSGVLTGKIVRAGEVLWGTPVKPLKQHLRQLAAVSRLPELLAEFERVRERVADLERKIVTPGDR